MCLCVLVSRSGWCSWPYKGGLSGVIYLNPVYHGGLVAASSSPGFCKSAQLVVCIHRCYCSFFSTTSIGIKWFQVDLILQNGGNGKVNFKQLTQ